MNRRFKRRILGKRFRNPEEMNQYKSYGSGVRWRKLRLVKLHKNPICENPFSIPDHLEAGQEVHHLKPVRQHPELAFDLQNLQTLCIPCHHRIHNGASIPK